MSVIEQLKALDEQREKLLSDAKAEALSRVEAALQTLNELGFSYRLVEGSQASTAPRSSGTRRTGVRQEVLQAVKDQGPIARAPLLEHMGVKGDRSGEQSVSNALAALKKSGEITATDGNYEAA